MRRGIKSEIISSSCRNLDMNDILKQSFSCAFAITTAVFSFIPEAVFGNSQKLGNLSAFILTIWKSSHFSSGELSIVLGRIAFLIISLCLSTLFSIIMRKFRTSRTFKGRNYNIKVKYGDLLKKKGCRVISFDECYTTKVGTDPADIKASSICGQYLLRYPIEDMQSLINAEGLKPERKGSEYKGQKRYKSGSLVSRDNDLLMAFARLDKDGKGFFASRAEYLESLNELWAELDKHYTQKDVFIPVLGAGVTRIGDVSPTQQELVDMIIYSYKLSQHKIKSTLCIVYKKSKDFSLSRIGETI